MQTKPKPDKKNSDDLRHANLGQKEAGQQRDSESELARMGDLSKSKGEKDEKD